MITVMIQAQAVMSVAIKAKSIMRVEVPPAGEQNR